ncbi:hypothetical protein FRB96_004416 [Tulasnella sp. 330]|nr:hypothetical protein FRB96_004416 [Tulasnella sp. 330]KAG8884515.1 hypothetical protein FRB97_004028 [Tulasnella sp. 331]
MFASLSTLLTPRSSSETARSVDSQCSSTRSYRIPSSNYYAPPSIFYGSPTRPNIEMQKPVWEVNKYNHSVSVCGEIEVDMSMFRHGDHIAPFSIGIYFTVNTPKINGNDSEDTDSENDSSPSFSSDSVTSFRGEWNQDGPGNYYRPQSFIHMEPRMIIDDTTCHVNFSIVIPSHLLPRAKDSRVYNVAVKAYELGDPDNVTEPSAARFMVLNRVRRATRGGLETTAMAMGTDGDDDDDDDDHEEEEELHRRGLKRVSYLASQMNIRMFMKRGGWRGKVF